MFRRVGIKVSGYTDFRFKGFLGLRGMRVSGFRSVRVQRFRVKGLRFKAI